MAENEIPYIWSKGVIRDHRLAHPENSHDAYIIPGNGHPTTLYNQLIANEIHKTAEALRLENFVRDSANMDYFESRVAQVERAIVANPNWLQSVREKAEKEGRELGWQIRLDAVFNVNEAMKANRKARGL